jgi:Flp pilus assembly protein TadD
VLLQQGRLDEAIPELRKALEIDPGMQQARMNLDSALQMRKGGH